MDITLSLTHDCNLACSYCYAGRKDKRAMSFETAQKALEFAFSFKHKSVQLGFFGGEPLLAWDLFKKSTELAEEFAARDGVKLLKTITTNATLIDEEKAIYLKEHGFYPAISLDGNRDAHDATRRAKGGESSFDDSIRGMDILLKYFPNAEVISVVDPRNVSFLMDSARYLYEEKNLIRLSLNPNFYTTWSKENLAIWKKSFFDLAELYASYYRSGKSVALNFIDGKIITQLKDGFECRDKCGFGTKEFAVAPSGNIYPCERLVGEDNDEKVCIGNVYTGFKKEKRQAILDKKGNVDKECKDCAVKDRCMNWCCCTNYAITGEIDKTDGIVCFHEQNAIEATDKIASELFKEKNPLFMERFYEPYI